MNLNEQPSLLQHEGAAGNFLSILLEGTKSNRSAVGARVSGDAGGRKQIREMANGDSYDSHSEFALFFGLGEAAGKAKAKAKTAESVVVSWPSAETQRFGRIEANRRISIKEDSEPQLRP